jgi:hypothetical protein
VCTSPLPHTCYMPRPPHSSLPVTAAWRVLGLRMEERPPDMEVTANTVMMKYDNCRVCDDNETTYCISSALAAIS